MENNRICDVCNVDVHWASYVRHLRSKKPLENENQNQMKIPDWLMKKEHTPIKNKFEEVYNPKTLKQIARQNIKKNDKELDKELAIKKINPSYFTDENSKIGSKVNLEIHIVDHANSLIDVIPNFGDIGKKQDIIMKF